ncbi:MAG: hypothetical protein ACYTDW_00590 [Planctomycetota bacterium]
MAPFASGLVPAVTEVLRNGIAAPVGVAGKPAFKPDQAAALVILFDYALGIPSRSDFQIIPGSHIERKSRYEVGHALSDPPIPRILVQAGPTSDGGIDHEGLGCLMGEQIDEHVGVSRIQLAIHRRNPHCGSGR